MMKFIFTHIHTQQKGKQHINCVKPPVYSPYTLYTYNQVQSLAVTSDLPRLEKNGPQRLVNLRC